MLNPGFGIADLHAEHEMPDFSRAVTTTFQQDLADEEYPFVYLNPRYCASGAYQWWGPKLRDIALRVSEEHSCLYADALKAVSQRIACIELIPYHCAGGPSPKLQKLPSATTAKNYVREELWPRAKAGEVLLIAARSIKPWGFSPTESSENVIVYGKGQVRGSSFSLRSPGGGAILRRLLG